MSAKPSNNRVLRALGHAWRMTNPWLPMIRDHRDRPVLLYRLDLRWRRPTDSADLPDPAFDRVRFRLLNISRVGMGAAPALLLTMAAVYLVFVLTVVRTRPSHPLPWIFLGMFVVTCIGSAFVYRYRVPKVGREAIARELLAERRCASCAYDLTATNPDLAGLTTCPECGAAWHLLPISQIPSAG